VADTCTAVRVTAPFRAATIRMLNRQKRRAALWRCFCSTVEVAADQWRRPTVDQRTGLWSCVCSQWCVCVVAVRELVQCRGFVFKCRVSGECSVGVGRTEATAAFTPFERTAKATRRAAVSETRTTTDSINQTVGGSI